jgi:hypothetical protein
MFRDCDKGIVKAKGCLLSPVKLMKLYLASQGLIGGGCFAKSRLYLELGLFLSQMAGDADILSTKMFVVQSRTNIVAREDFEYFKKRLRTMGSDIDQLMDDVTGGKFFMLQEELGSVRKELGSVRKELGRASKELEFKKKELEFKKKELEFKKEEIEFKKKEIERLKTGSARTEEALTKAVLYFHENNKKVEEIAKITSLKGSVVLKILEDNGLA